MRRTTTTTPRHGRGRRVVGAAVATVVAAATGLTTAGAAGAEEAPTVVVCDGTIARQQVYADVRVPAGAHCSLDRVGVHGDLVVEAGGWAHLRSSAVVRDLVVHGEAHVEHTTAHRDLHLSGDAVLDLYRSSVEGTLHGSTRDLTVNHARVHGDLDVALTRSSELQRLRVDGSARLTGDARSLRIGLVDLRQDLVVEGADALVLCGATIGRDLTVSGSGAVHIGGAGAGWDPCWGAPPKGSPATDRYLVTVHGDAHLGGNEQVTVHRLVVHGAVDAPPGTRGL